MYGTGLPAVSILSTELLLGPERKREKEDSGRNDDCHCMRERKRMHEERMKEKKQ